MPTCYNFEALLQLALMVYRSPVCQKPFQAVAYKNWILCQSQQIEQLFTDL